MSPSATRLVTTARVLDEGFWITRQLIGRWGGVLFLGLLPVRFLEVHFFNRLLSLSSNAGTYGDYLQSIAWGIVLALIPASWARMVWVQACRKLISEHEVPGRSNLRVDPGALLGFFTIKLVILIGLYLTGLSLVGLLVFVAIGGVAAAASVEMGPTPGAALRPMGRGGRASALAGATFVFATAFLFLLLNLGVAVLLANWVAGVLPWGSPVAMIELTSTRLLNLHLAAGALVILEPFWLACMVVLRELARHRSTGGDLLLRFNRLSARLTVAVLALMVPAMGASGQMDTLTRSEYAQRIGDIESLVADDRLDEAARLAADLSHREWRTDDGTVLLTDRELLERIARADGETSVPSGAVRQRLRSIRTELESRAVRSRVASDRQKLEQIVRASGPAPIPEGGAVPDPLEDLGLIEELIEVVFRALEWISEKLSGLFDWIYDRVFGERREEVDVEGGGALSAWMTALLVAVALVSLSWFVLRNSRRRERSSPGVSVSEIVRVAEEDPRSRRSNQWLDLADSLLEAGRVREALRAAYNAVLTTLFSLDLLDYRRGKTNWEYVRAISSGTEWKGQFMRVTADFDRFWYGTRAPDDETYRSFRSAVESILSTIGGARA